MTSSFQVSTLQDFTRMTGRESGIRLDWILPATLLALEFSHFSETGENESALPDKVASSSLPPFPVSIFPLLPFSLRRWGQAKVTQSERRLC